MSDSYELERRTSPGTVAPANFGGLAQLIQGGLGPLIQSFLAPRPLPAQRDLGPQQTALQQPPTSTQLEERPQQQPQEPPQQQQAPEQPPQQEQPPEQPQQQPPEQPPEQQPEPPQQQGDPTTQPIIEPYRPEQPPQPPASAQPALQPSPVSPAQMAQSWSLPQRTNFQAFVPNSPKGYQTWGKPKWTEQAVEADPEIMRTSLAPSQREAYGVIGGAAAQMGQWGNPATSAPAMAAGAIAKFLGPFIDMLSGGGKTPFTSAFNAAETQSLNKQKFLWQQQKEYFEMQREHMLDLNDQAVRAHRATIGEARDVLEEYKIGTIDEPQARQRLIEWAQRNGDDKLLAAIDSGGLKAAENWLAHREAKIDDMAIAGRSLRASDRRRREAAGGKPEGYTGRDLVEGGDKGDDEERTDASGRRLLPGASGTTRTGRLDDDQRQPVADAASPDEVDQQVGKTYGLNSKGVAFARDLAETGKVEGQTPTAFGNQFKGREGIETWRKIQAASQAFKQRIAQAVADRPDDTTDTKLARLEQVSPRMAGVVRGLGRYGEDVNKMPQEVRRMYTDAAKAVYKKYDPANFVQANKYHDESRAPNMVMKKAAALPQNYIQVLGVLQRMDENTNIPKSTIDMWLAGNWRGDSNYAELGELMQSFQQNASAVQSQTGRPYVTLVRAMMDRAGPNVSPRTIRAVLQQQMIDVWPHVHGTQVQWERYNSEEVVPGMTASAWKGYSDIVRMDPQTGEVPSDSGPEMLGVGKDPKKAAKGVKPQTPLTADEAVKWSNRIRELQREGTPEAMKRAAALSKVVGSTLDPPWRKEYLGRGRDYAD